MDKATVDRFEDAKVGDYVWVMPYDMRGNDRCQLHTVTKITRQSIIIGDDNWSTQKFNKEDGRQRGTDWPARIYGEKQLRDSQFLLKHRHRIGVYLTGSTDADMLRKIAELIGYEVKS